MITLKEAEEHIGYGVFYQPYPVASVEVGVIIGVNHISGLVFVRYDGSETPKGTSPDRLMPSSRWEHL